jgi:hypothetical protein
MIMTNTTTGLLAYAAEAEANAAAQDAEAATMLRAIERERSSLAYAHKDRRTAHRKATRLDRPNGHAQGREEERKITEERIPAIEARIAEWQAEFDHCTADAARLRAVAADYRAAAGLATIDLPAPFCAWLDGTGLALGHDDSDPECKETREAYDAGTHHGTHTTVTATPTVLRLLTEYAENLIDANSDSTGDPAEITAAQAVITRVTAARRTVKAAQAQQGPQEAPTAPAAPQEAPTAAQEPQARPRTTELASTTIGSDVVTLVEITGGEFTHGVDTYRPADDADEHDHGTPKGTPVLSAQAGFYSESEARADYAREVTHRTQEAQDAPAADIVVPVGTTVTVTQRGQEFTGIVETAGPLRAATIAHAKQGTRTHRVGIRIPGRVGFIWADSHETTPTA